MKGIPGTLQEGGAAFPMTQWSVVLDALQSQAPETAQTALTSICQSYWPPVYTFLRRRGFSPSDAEDLAQAFFAHLLELNTLSRARQEKGRLRTFLLGSLENFLHDQRDRAQALKRGGGKQIVSMSESLVEIEAAISSTTNVDEPTEYDRAWAAALVRRTWEQLRKAFFEEGKEQIFEELQGLVLGGADLPPSQEEIAARLHMQPATLRTHLHRIRQRYREFLRAEVARTVATPAEIDAEMRYLFQLLIA